MSYFLLDLPEGSFTGTGNGVLKASDRQDFDSAADLLADIRDRAAEQQAVLEKARQDAYDDALEEARAMLTQSLAHNAEDFARQIKAIEARLSASVAEAALAAATSIIGDMPKQAVTEHIARKLLQSYSGDGPVRLHLSPANAANLAERIEPSGGVNFIADPALGDTDCHLADGKRTIVADLSVQLSAIAEKWGVANMTPPSATPTDEEDSEE
ncbi:MAG: hypothetical protein HC843_03520 [Sphingomonadales bacterium]|nr:hypothetical protein [Sphingomonadales bacterium]